MTFCNVPHLKRSRDLLRAVFLVCVVQLLQFDILVGRLEGHESLVERDRREQRQRQRYHDDPDRQVRSELVVNGRDEDGADEASKASGRRQNAHPEALQL